jgi:hypothetical protein
VVWTLPLTIEQLPVATWLTEGPDVTEAPGSKSESP